jgi:hypothetical protein
MPLGKESLMCSSFIFYLKDNHYNKFDLRFIYIYIYPSN